MHLTRISAVIVGIAICPVLLIGSSASPPASHAKAVRTVVRMEQFERQSITFSLAVDGRAACQVAPGEPLTRGDGKSCRSYREVMTWLFMTQGLSGIEDEDRTLAFVDRSAPTTLQLELRYQHWEEGEFPFVLSPVWDALE